MRFAEQVREWRDFPSSSCCCKMASVLRRCTLLKGIAPIFIEEHYFDASHPANGQLVPLVWWCVTFSGILAIHHAKCRFPCWVQVGLICSTWVVAQRLICDCTYNAAKRPVMYQWLRTYFRFWTVCHLEFSSLFKIWSPGGDRPGTCVATDVESTLRGMKHWNVAKHCCDLWPRAAPTSKNLQYMRCPFTLNVSSPASFMYYKFTSTRIQMCSCSISTHTPWKVQYMYFNTALLHFFPKWWHSICTWLSYAWLCT